MVVLRSQICPTIMTATYIDWAVVILFIMSSSTKYDTGLLNKTKYNNSDPGSNTFEPVRFF